MSSYKFSVECPYCHFKQQILTSETDTPMSEHSEIIMCDPEEGGCELDFAIKWQLYPRYQVFTLNPLKVS
jgi:hypothetical protein